MVALQQNPVVVSSWKSFRRTLWSVTMATLQQNSVEVSQWQHYHRTLWRCFHDNLIAELCGGVTMATHAELWRVS